MRIEYDLHPVLGHKLIKEGIESAFKYSFLQKDKSCEKLIRYIEILFLNIEEYSTNEVLLIRQSVLENLCLNFEKWSFKADFLDLINFAEELNLRWPLHVWMYGTHNRAQCLHNCHGCTYWMVLRGKITKYADERLLKRNPLFFR